MWRLISVFTFFSRFIRKWVEPIQALIVPKGCSTILRLSFIGLCGARSIRRCMASMVVLPAGDAALDAGRTLRLRRASLAARPVPVAVQRQPALHGCHVVGEQGARRAAVDVLV